MFTRLTIYWLMQSIKSAYKLRLTTVAWFWCWTACVWLVDRVSLWVWDLQKQTAICCGSFYTCSFISSNFCNEILYIYFAVTFGIPSSVAHTSIYWHGNKACTWTGALVPRLITCGIVFGTILKGKEAKTAKLNIKNQCAVCSPWNVPDAINNWAHRQAQCASSAIVGHVCLMCLSIEFDCLITGIGAGHVAFTAVDA